MGLLQYELIFLASGKYQYRYGAGSLAVTTHSYKPGTSMRFLNRTEDATKGLLGNRSFLSLTLNFLGSCDGGLLYNRSFHI